MSNNKKHGCLWEMHIRKKSENVGASSDLQDFGLKIYRNIFTNLKIITKVWNYIIKMSRSYRNVC